MALVYLSNSYVNLGDANQYFADRVGTASWDALDNNAKEDALVSATRQLDEQYVYLGYAVSTSQPLAWPRVGSYEDPKLGLLVELDPENSPERLKVATYEMALHLLNNPSVLENTPSVDSIKVGSIELSGLGNQPGTPKGFAQIISPLTTSGSSGRSTVWRAW
jgi:hypothetical protein